MPKRRTPKRPARPTRGKGLPGAGLPASTLPPDQRLGAALERQDAAAVAFALRNDHVIVPLLPVEGPPQVRVFRRGEADKYMLLLFSAPEHYAAMTPQEPEHRVLAYDAATLRDFLEQNIGVLEAVWFDVAGPHAMQAEPQDVLDALRLPRDGAADTDADGPV
jgi:hypothetical protein